MNTPRILGGIQSTFDPRNTPAVCLGFMRQNAPTYTQVSPMKIKGGPSRGLWYSAPSAKATKAETMPPAGPTSKPITGITGICWRIRLPSMFARYQTAIGHSIVTAAGAARRTRALAPVRHEPVADARLRDDVARRLRVRLDLLAQAGDVHVQIVRLVAVFGAPDPAQQHAVGDQLVRLRGEGAQQRVLP